MKEEYVRIINEYLSMLALAGRHTQRPKHDLTVFFNYVENHDIDFKRIRISEAQEFQTHLTITPGSNGSLRYTGGSVRNIIGTVRVFYDYLKKKNDVFNTPFAVITRMRVNKPLPRQMLREDDMHTLLMGLRNFLDGESLQERKRRYIYHVIAEVLYATGARINEIEKIRVGDIDFDRSVILITDSKTRKERYVIINEYAKNVLALYLREMRKDILVRGKGKDGDLVFGTKWIQFNFNKYLRAEGEKLGFERFTSHQFRHAVGYHLLRAGCDIRYIQEILGHNNLSSTQIYTRLDKEDLKNIIDTYHPRSFRRDHEEH